VKGGGIVTWLHTGLIKLNGEKYILVRNLEEKRHVWNPGHRLEDIIKKDLTVYGLDL
jgi:hypothetical protein